MGRKLVYWSLTWLRLCEMQSKNLHAKVHKKCPPHVPTSTTCTTPRRSAPIEPTCLRSQGTTWWWSGGISENHIRKRYNHSKNVCYTAILFHESRQHHSIDARIYSYTETKTNRQDPRRNDHATLLCSYQSGCNNVILHQWHGIVHTQRHILSIRTRRKIGVNILFYLGPKLENPRKNLS